MILQPNSCWISDTLNCWVGLLQLPKLTEFAILVYQVYGGSNDFFANGPTSGMFVTTNSRPGSSNCYYSMCACCHEIRVGPSFWPKMIARCEKEGITDVFIARAAERDKWKNYPKDSNILWHQLNEYRNVLRLKHSYLDVEAATEALKIQSK